MRILINSDSSIAMNAELAKHIVGEATELLDRFSDRLTRVEIHLSDWIAERPARSIRDASLKSGSRG
jgi:hypothetical protein